MSYADMSCYKCGKPYTHTLWCQQGKTREEWMGEQTSQFKKLDVPLGNQDIYECPRCKSLVVDRESHVSTHYKVGLV